MSRSAGRNVFNVTGVASLAGADQARREIEDALVQRLEEVAGLEEVGHPVERFVVDQHRAEQRLLRLDVVRRGAKC